MALAGSVLAEAPQGLASAVATLNGMPQDVFAELGREVIRFLQYKAGTVNVDNLRKRLRECNVELDRSALQSAVNALTFVFRTAAQQRVSADDLVAELHASLIWSDGCLAVLKHLWTDQGKLLTDGSAASRSLNVGQLVSVDWKLAMAVSSSTCRGLNTPFITLQLKVAEPSGQLVTRSVEMSIAEFQGFTQEMKAMAALLETT